MREHGWDVARAAHSSHRTSDLGYSSARRCKSLRQSASAASAAVERLRLIPVLFELGARPHAARALYRAYLEQSHVFVAIYFQRYGWVAPGEEISGLEDEYRLSGGLPRLVYLATRRRTASSGLSSSWTPWAGTTRSPTRPSSPPPSSSACSPTTSRSCSPSDSWSVSRRHLRRRAPGPTSTPDPHPGQQPGRQDRRDRQTRAQHRLGQPIGDGGGAGRDRQNPAGNRGCSPRGGAASGPGGLRPARGGSRPGCGAAGCGDVDRPGIGRWGARPGCARRCVRRPCAHPGPRQLRAGAPRGHAGGRAAQSLP